MWSELTLDKLKARLSGPELDALRDAATLDAQSDPVPEVIAQVTNEVRGYIAGCPKNNLGGEGTLPPEVHSAALAIVRWRLAGRLAIGGGAQLLSGDARRQEYEDALTFLRDVRDCKISLEQPEGAPSTVGKWGSETRVDFSPETTP